MMGVTPERAARELREAGAHVVGTNCGNGIDNMVEVAKAMRQETDGYLLVHSNAGIPAMKGGQIIYPESSGVHGRAVQTARRYWSGHHRRLLRHRTGAHSGVGSGPGTLI